MMTNDAPRVTLLLTTYNHERFVFDALASCFEQDYSNLEIFISDDSSTDRTWDVIKAEAGSYDGPHEVNLNRNPKNLFLEHLPAIVGELKGDLIVVACGDDVQYPTRVSRLVDLWKKTGASILASGARQVDSAGQPIGYQRVYDSAPDLSLDAFLRSGDNATCFGAGLAWHREVSELFGCNPKGTRNIDFSYPFRGLLLNGAAFINEPLLDWRRHDDNMTIGLQMQKSSDEIEKLLLRERWLLNVMANWHGVMEDVQKWYQQSQDQATLTKVNSAAVQHIVNLMSKWRPVRHQLAQAKVGIH